MREREPYLHHEYVGRWQDQTGRMMSRPGEKWSETLLRRCDEAVLVGKIRGEQIRRGVDRKEWVGISREEEEEEKEEEEEEEESDEEILEDKSRDTNVRLPLSLIYYHTSNHLMSLTYTPVHHSETKKNIYKHIDIL